MKETYEKRWWSGQGSGAGGQWSGGRGSAGARAPQPWPSRWRSPPPSAAVSRRMRYARALSRSLARSVGDRLASERGSYLSVEAWRATLTRRLCSALVGSRGSGAPERESERFKECCVTDSDDDPGSPSPIGWALGSAHPYSVPPTEHGQ